MQRADLKVRKVLRDPEQSKLQRYQSLIIGQPGLGPLTRYEAIVTLSSWVPGALGLFLRSKLYPHLLGGVGRNVIFGTNIVLRHPHKIVIGNNVVIDDNCLLDAKGVRNKGIQIGSSVFLGRNGILSCKDGDIVLEDGVNVGFNCEIFSSSSVVVGQDTLIAAYCYLIGGGNYDLGRSGVPFAEQLGLSSRGGIRVARDVWIGASAQVLDGVTIGEGAVIGAGALVREDVPAMSIAGGVPARLLGRRDDLTVETRAS